MSPTLHSAPWRSFRRQLAQSATMERYWRSHLPGFFGRTARFISSDYRHSPTLSTSSFLGRFTLRLRVGRRTVVKFVRGNSVNRGTFLVFQCLAKKSSRHLFTPRPLAFFSPPGYILYEEAGGQTLRLLPLVSSRWLPVLPRVGTALGVFQRTSGRGLRRLPWVDERRFLIGVAATIARRAPRLARWSHQTLAVLAQHERLAWGRNRGLVHRDFQASNILLDRRGIGVIDFTLSGRGPIALDVGAFMTHLSIMTDGRLSSVQLARWRQGFLAGYRRTIGPVRWKQVERDLPIFELRSAVDILALTLMTLGDRSRVGRRYVDLLVALADRQVAKVPAI